MDYRHVFLTLASPNLERLVPFYQALFHQPPQPYQPGRYAEFHLPALTLALFQPAADQGESFAASPHPTLALCFEVPSLTLALATCTALGCTAPAPIRHASHGQEVYVYDPDGNRIILHEGATPEDRPNAG